MYTADGKYNMTELEKDEAAEKAAHAEEMNRAMERLAARSARKRRSFIAAASGVLTGVLYILWIAFGSEILLPGGKSLYEAYISLAGGKDALCVVLDFAPPAVLATVLSLLASKGERGKFYFVLTALFACLIVVAVFMLYMSMMAG